MCPFPVCLFFRRFLATMSPCVFTLGIPEPLGSRSPGAAAQRAAEVGRMGAGCAAVPWLLSRGSALTPGMPGEAPEQWDCRCRGRLSPLLPLGSPRADAGR